MRPRLALIFTLFLTAFAIALAAWLAFSLA
jgi:hypothetical protein